MPSIVSAGPFTPNRSIPTGYPFQMVDYFGTPTVIYSNMRPMMVSANPNSVMYPCDNNNDSTESLKHVTVFCSPPAFPVPVASFGDARSHNLSKCGVPVMITNDFSTPPPLYRSIGSSSGSYIADTSELSIILGSDIRKLAFSEVPNSLVDWIDSGCLEVIAKDKGGSRMLQERFPKIGDPARGKLYGAVLQPETFRRLSHHIFGNFLIQKMLVEARGAEKDQLVSLFVGGIPLLCADRYSCRVVQTMLDVVLEEVSAPLVAELCGYEVQMATDQSASHVLQKIFKRLPLRAYAFIPEAFASDRCLVKYVVEDKYGCRVVQTLLETLDEQKSKGTPMAESFLNRLAATITADSASLITHEFANYIVQHILQSSSLTAHRNGIICNILKNILSLSQEKYASNVVETAFRRAPLRLLRLMMQEVFEGYESDEDGCDALDIMLFDQFGNYVVQTMLEVAVEVHMGGRQGDLAWLHRLALRIQFHRSKLSNYSSGKKLIAKIDSVMGEGEFTPPKCAENYNCSPPNCDVPEKYR